MERKKKSRIVIPDDWSEACKDCGLCCGCYPLPRWLVAKYADRVQRAVQWVPYDEKYIHPKTADGKCPFLSVWDKRCVVYEDRPWVCRLYGTDETIPCLKLNPKVARVSFRDILARVGREFGIEVE